MFAYFTQKWRGESLVSYEIIVNLIGSTTTKTGLTIRAELDTGLYTAGRKIPDAEFADLQVKREVVLHK
jgi:hypothetical protein